MTIIEHIRNLEARVAQLEELLLTENNLLSTKACAKGAVEGIVNLMQELADLKYEIIIIKENQDDIKTAIRILTQKLKEI
jgi:hypothetical protein